MVGKTISHYKILDKIGEGGMGIVYKAEDTRLERTVALKFLAGHLVEDTEGRRRFEREAKAAAALDHPNICTIHEIDEAEGQTFLAMAYIEGQSVKQKVGERPLKLDEALDIAIQVAEGLHAAHEKGIVHRDIKSANLIVTPQHQVKIMDFGLARLADRTQLTRTATILGTPAYMSPEQAQRQTADHRTDIWSLGAVLYEMVTGRLPFDSDREEAVLYSIIHDEPEAITELRVGVPVELDRIVAKAMAKDPAERYAHIDDMAVDLRAVRKSLELTPRATLLQSRLPASTLRAPRRTVVPWLVAAAAVMVALVSLWQSSRSAGKTPPPMPVRLSITLPPEQSLAVMLDRFSGVGSSVAISPDGSKLAMVVRQDDTTVLQLRRFGEFQPETIPGTEGGRAPFFSPDGESVGFAVRNTVKTVALSGGTTRSVAGFQSHFGGGTWTPDNQIWVGDCTFLLKRFAADTVSPRLARVGELNAEHPTGIFSYYPQVLPDGQNVLASSGRGILACSPPPASAV